MMLEIKPEPRKKAFISVAVTFEMRDALNVAAKKLDVSTSELMRQLAQNFLDGKFDGVEVLRQRQIKKERTQRKGGKK